MPTTLDRRTLNRTLLARQLLLEPARTGALDVIEHLVGMQSQAPAAPYLGLWTRLEDFAFAELAQLMTDRRVVRIVLMRTTVHLVSAADALRLRPLVQPGIDRAFSSSGWARGCAGVGRDELVAAGREWLIGEPRDPAQLRDLCAARWPDADPASLVNALRGFAPLVQVPPRGLWGMAGRPVYAALEDWLDRPLAEPDHADMVRRYLAAFGPATVADAQKWSGMTRLREVFAGMALRTYRDENGRTLYDLPDAPLADPATPVPARFVADFDNLLLSHADRGRILAEEHRRPVMGANVIVRGTFLVDGFVGGTWRIDRARGSATLSLAPFARLSGDDRDALVARAARLLRASDPDAAHDIRCTDPG